MRKRVQRKLVPLAGASALGQGRSGTGAQRRKREGPGTSSSTREESRSSMSVVVSTVLCRVVKCSVYCSGYLGDSPTH